MPERASADILYRHGDLRFIDANDPSRGHVFELTQAIQVLAPAGRSATEIVLYLSEWDELEMFWGRVIDGENEIHDMPPGVLQTEVPTDVYMMSTGARRVHIHPGGVDVGSIFEFGYRIRSTRPFDLPAWELDMLHPVRESRFEVHVPEGYEIGYGAAVDGAPIDIEPLTAGGDMVFYQQNVPALRIEYFGAPVVDQQRRLRLHVRGAPKAEGAFPDWGAVSRWYQERVRSQEHIPPELKAAARTEVDTFDGPADQALFDMVHRRVRYVALFSGIGAFVPHAAATTWRAGYGDCKDMATLLVGLLREFGYEAHPVLISTRGHPDIDPRIPGLTAFNHVIVASRRSPNGPWVYSDPTDSVAGFGELGWSTMGRPSLMIRAGADLERTPSFRAEAHRTDVQIFVEATGDVKLEARLSAAAGRPFRELALDFGLRPSRKVRVSKGVTVVDKREETPAEARARIALLRMIQKLLVPALPLRHIDDVRLRREGSAVLVEARLNRSAVLGPGGCRLQLADLWRPMERLPASAEGRLWLGAPFAVRESIHLDGLLVQTPSLPSASWKSPGLYLDFEVRRRGDRLVLSRTVQRDRASFRARELDELTEWSSRADRLKRQWISLEDSP